jgi:hypothetical protein
LGKERSIELKCGLILLVCFILLTGAFAASADVVIGTNVTLTAKMSGISLLSDPVGYNVTSISINDTDIVFEYPAYENATDYWEYNDTIDWNGTRFAATTYDFPCIRDGTCSRGPIVLIGTIIPFVLLSMVYAIYWRKKR